MYEHIKPKEMKKEIFDRLVEAWSNGLSDREACFYASPDMEFVHNDLKDMYLDNPALLDLRDGLKMKLTTSARKVVKKAIEKGNEKTARWYLEKKMPDEFGTKAQITVDRPIEVSLSDKEAQMEAFMEQFVEE